MMFLHKKLTVDHFIHLLNSFFSLISLPCVILEIASIDDFLLELSLILKLNVMLVVQRAKQFWKRL